MARTAALVCALLSSAAGAAAPAPHPPCAAPAGIVPAVPESMCSTVVADSRDGVVIRSYGVPVSERLVTDTTPPNFLYDQVLDISVSNIFVYLGGANSASRYMLSNRTVPITIRPPGDEWRVSMMVSSVAYPDAARVPTPNNFEMLIEAVGERLFAALAFNTTALPTEAEFQAACARLRKGVPKRFSVVEDGWSPTYVLYSPQAATLWTNECWIQVNRTA